MAEEVWHYLENQFDNSTKRSLKRAHAQGVFHESALAAAPAAIAGALASRLAAAWTPFEAKYGQWLNLRGQLKGATQALEEGFEALSGDDIEEIETAFKGAYKRGTPAHTSAFPQGREPFQQGGRGARKVALEGLVTRMGQLHVTLTAELAEAQGASAPAEVIEALERRVASLNAAIAPALARRDALEMSRQEQDTLETQVTLARENLEPLRVTLADALYANMMQLGLHFYRAHERAQVAAFFDLELLQRTEPEEEEPPVIPPPAP